MMMQTKQKEGKNREKTANHIINFFRMLLLLQELEYLSGKGEVEESQKINEVTIRSEAKARSGTPSSLPTKR